MATAKFFFYLPQFIVKCTTGLTATCTESNYKMQKHWHQSLNPVWRNMVMRSTTKVKCCRHLKLDTKMPRKCQDKTSCYYSSQEHITEIAYENSRYKKSLPLKKLQRTASSQLQTIQLAQ